MLKELIGCVWSLLKIPFATVFLLFVLFCSISLIHHFFQITNIHTYTHTHTHTHTQMHSAMWSEKMDKFQTPSKGKSPSWSSSLAPSLFIVAWLLFVVVAAAAISINWILFLSYLPSIHICIHSSSIYNNLSFQDDSFV